MAEHSFRVLLDFRELNFKFYKFVWMSVSPRELVTIKDLKDAILKKFCIDRTDLLLFLRDGLLPEDESISNILRENDNIRLVYSEPSNLNLKDSGSNYEEIQSSNSDDQVEPSKKRKSHSDVSINFEDNEQIKSSKKRKHSFSNGTYIYENSRPENSDIINNVLDIQNDTITGLPGFENQHNISKIKKKLKYSKDVSQNSFISENETFLSSDIIPRSEKYESKVNSCKKKKKHKHSKDISDNELFSDIVTISEINENESSFRKKKKKCKHSHVDSKSERTSKATVSFCEEIVHMPKKLDKSVNHMESNNEPLELNESVFETVVDDSEILKLTPVSLSTSVNTSSGIGSLKDSGENNRKMSSEKDSGKSCVSDNKPVSEQEDNSLISQGSNCKKRKRKRHRKRKSLLIEPQVDESIDSNLDMPLQRNEKLDPSFASSPYQTARSSPQNLETPSSAKSSSYPFGRNKSSLEAKSIFVEPFTSYLTNTSTPFPQTNVVSPASVANNVSNIPSHSNISQNQSGSIITSENSTQKKVIRGSIDQNFSYEDCPPLNSCPLVGTRIAFKVLELDGTYSPVVSDYKEGIVKSVNSRTDELEIELIEPEVKEGRTGKFENLYEDELPASEEIREVKLSWPTIIDPVKVVC